MRMDRCDINGGGDVEARRSPVRSTEGMPCRWPLASGAASTAARLGGRCLVQSDRYDRLSPARRRCRLVRDHVGLALVGVRAGP